MPTPATTLETSSTTTRGPTTMWALQYLGPHITEWAEVAMPQIHYTTDAIVRVDMTTICGSDLNILKGDVPEVTVGRILGHEAVGTVEEIGTGVTGVEVGDRAIVSAITSCAICVFCRQTRYGQCINGG